MNEPLTTADDKFTQENSSTNPAIVPGNKNEAIVVPKNKNVAHQPSTLRCSQHVSHPPDRYNPY